MVTDDEIREVQILAEREGDDDLAGVCEQALRGSRKARRFLTTRLERETRQRLWSKEG